jgi:hypothetical protein
VDAQNFGAGASAIIRGATPRLLARAARTSKALQAVAAA